MTRTRTFILIAALSLLLGVASTGTASASSGALKILISYSDGAHTEKTLKDQLAALPGVATVDTVDAGAATPALPTLQGYDIVLTFSSTDYATSDTLGANLP